MMKKRLLSILFLVVLVSVYILFKKLPTKDTELLPENFTLYLFLDATSSGATRHYKFYISFKGDEIVSANRSAYIASTMGGEKFCTQVFNVSRGKWGEPTWKYNGLEGITIEKEGTPCFEEIYMSREEIIRAIQLGKIVPKEKGCHYQTCFEIIED